jgi:hypothetical protein
MGKLGFPSSRFVARPTMRELPSPVSGRHVVLNATARESLQMLKLCKCQPDSHQSVGLPILRSEVESDVSMGPAIVQMGHVITGNLNVCSCNRGPLVISTYAVGIRRLLLSLISSAMAPLQLCNKRNFGNSTLREEMIN